MIIFGVLLACGEKESTSTDTSAAVDTATSEDSNIDDTGRTEDTDTSSDTEDSDTDTSDTNDTNDTQDTEDTQVEDPQWFEVGTYPGTYSCEQGLSAFSTAPSLTVKTTGTATEIEVTGASVPFVWNCVITENTTTPQPEWDFDCTGPNSSYFFNGTVHAENFTVDMTFLFPWGPNGDILCDATFE
jgi:hypothetical protein